MSTVPVRVIVELMVDPHVGPVDTQAVAKAVDAAITAANIGYSGRSPFAETARCISLESHHVYLEPSACRAALTTIHNALRFHAHWGPTMVEWLRFMSEAALKVDKAAPSTLFDALELALAEEPMVPVGDAASYGRWSLASELREVISVHRSSEALGRSAAHPIRPLTAIELAELQGFRSPPTIMASPELRGYTKPTAEITVNGGEKRQISELSASTQARISAGQAAYSNVDQISVDIVLSEHATPCRKLLGVFLAAHGHQIPKDERDDIRQVIEQGGEYHYSGEAGSFTIRPARA